MTGASVYDRRRFHSVVITLRVMTRLRVITRSVMSTLATAVACCGLLAPHVNAQRDAKVPDPDPEIERRSLQVAEGFEINLFAADPLLAKPIQMNADAAGRLWVASGEVIRRCSRPKAGNKIIVLEDTDGDGRADRTTVFARRVLISRSRAGRRRATSPTARS